MATKETNETKETSPAIFSSLFVERAGTIRIDGDFDPRMGDLWVDLKRELTWEEMERVGTTYGLTMAIPFGKARKNEIDDQENVEVHLDPATLKLRKLAFWIVAWSEKKPVNQHSLRHLSLGVANVLFGVIEQLEKVAQGAVLDSESPLGRLLSS